MRISFRMDLLEGSVFAVCTHVREVQFKSANNGTLSFLTDFHYSLYQDRDGDDPEVDIVEYNECNSIDGFTFYNVATFRVIE